VRFNVIDKGIGIQTPHNWHLYSHGEIRLFPHPMVSSIKIGVVSAQLGYNWLLEERGAVRSGVQVTYWGFAPAQEEENIYYFTEIIPIGISLYPFEKNYMGIDLHSILNPYTLNLNVGATFLVRF
tara:strand:- start:1539 stop:1913 length:375 start_codon:yes stop_codon:yes gene_type:complete